MHLSQLNRWQWVAIGLFVGLIAGALANTVGGVDLDNPANSINTQRAFEDSILNPVVYWGVKYPQWKDVRVVRVYDPSRPSGLSYLVMGKHHARSPVRRPPRKPDPNFKVEYTDHLFRASQPYLPLNRQIADSAEPVRASANLFCRLAEALRLKEPEESKSVLGFLDQVRANNPGFTYSYQWWRRPRITMLVWTLGSVVVIGGVWPFIVCLLTHGKLFPPAPEKGIDLRKVSTGSPEPESKLFGAAAAGMDPLHRLEAELEARFSGSGAASSTEAATVDPDAKLTGEQPQAVAESPKVYEAKTDDYYPTQRQQRPK